MARFTDFTDNERESGYCSVCGSFNRQRQMAWALRSTLALPMHGPWRLPRRIAIYNLECNGPLHQRLRRESRYTSSEYLGPNHVPGEVVGGIRHEDLQRLSFQDGSFDIVMSSDVLEHMPDPYRAHREIWRVLKAGGVHLFTVPFDEQLEHDQPRAKLVEGTVHHLAEPLFHGDPVRPNEGILVWTIFGVSMVDRLATMGFDVSMHRILARSSGIRGRNALVFSARKPASAVALREVVN